jgi:hypothetical protein
MSRIHSGGGDVSDLPEFEKRPLARVMPLIHDVFGASLVSLEAFEDGHFRVVFRRHVFTLPEETSEPSRSQWTTLKKRLKRRDRRIFIFRDYGKVSHEQPSEALYYIDFGFFRYD